MAKKNKKIKGFKTTILRCARCKTWYCRLPNFLSSGDKGDACEKCGNTSFDLSVGRIIGPKHRQWEFFFEEYKELKLIRFFGPGNEEEDYVVYKT